MVRDAVQDSLTRTLRARRLLGARGFVGEFRPHREHPAMKDAGVGTITRRI